MKIKTLLFALSALPIVAGGIAAVDSCKGFENRDIAVQYSEIKRLDYLKDNLSQNFGFNRELIDSRLLDRLGAYPESASSDTQTSEINDALQAYFKELSNGGELNEYTFSGMQTLTFDGSSSENCNAIPEINGLSSFKFTSLTKIEIKNMDNLTAANFGGLVGASRIFPNLKTIVVENCENLETLNFAGNTAITTIKISACPQISFDLPTEVCQTLETLSISGAENNFVWTSPLVFPKLTTLEVIDTGMSQFSVNGYVLKTATITGNESLTSLTISASELNDLTLQNNPNLQMLDLAKCVNIKNFNLDKMDFEENGVVISRNLVYAPDLRTFFLGSNDWMTEFDLSRSPNLQTIVISSCTNLTKLDLADTLSSLITLDLTGCRNLLDVNFLSAVNLYKLSLAECGQLKNAIFENIGTYSQLQYLDVSGTGVQQIDFKNFESLEILFLGSSYLTDVKLDNLPKLYQFEIANSANLKQIELSNLEKLKTFTPQNCDNVEEIIISNTGLEEFKVSNKNRLKTLALSCAGMNSLTILSCNSLTSLDFAECQALTALEIVSCASLDSNSLASLESIVTITSVTVSQCSNIYGFSLADKPNLSVLNLKYLNNLTSLSLSNLGQNTRIYLPSKLTLLRSLTLTGLYGAQFDSATLDVSHGVLSSVRLSNVPFTKIDFCDNVLASISISNTRYLKEINLSNNRITNIEAVMSLLASCELLEYVNLNNNRIDFSKGEALKTLQSSQYRHCVVLGVQNVINNNKYTYEPNIYYGGLGVNSNIRAVVYHHNAIYRVSEISDSTLRKFEHSNLVEDRFKKCKNGTYYITFEKIDNNGKKIEMTDEEKSQFLPIYFTVSKDFDIIKIIWIIFVAFAGLIFVYVGISWLIERRRKQRLLGDDVEDITGGGTKLSRKEIKLAEREHRKLFKENDKLDKQERKIKQVADKERLKSDKENAKEQQKQNAENAKLAKIAEKARAKEDKEQRKLDKEREKLLRERGESSEIKVNEDKKMKTPEEREKEKVLKKEQKELKRMEKENLRAEKMREKNEEREILGETNRFSNIFSKKAKKVEDDVDFDADALAANYSAAHQDEQFDADSGLSDKDLDEILAARKSPSSSPKIPPKPVSPKLPPRPKK